MALGIHTANDNISAEDVRQRLAGREYEVVSKYLGPPNVRLSNDNEIRWGNHGSFKLTLRGENAGLWFDYEHGEGGDLFSFLQREHNCTFLQALRMAADFCGIRPQPSRSPSASRVVGLDAVIDAARDEEERTRKACELWEQSCPIPGTLAEKYLREVRRYNIPEFAHNVLRFHPACPWGCGTAPTLVARVDDIASGDLIGIHRTALYESGHKIGRKYLGVTTGGAIQLWPRSEVRDSLCIGEGIETSLAGHALLGLEPVWSLLDAGNLANFPLVPGVRQLQILVDHDPAGKEAAAKVQRRYETATRTVQLIMPDQPGNDMDDEWNGARRRPP